MPLPVKSHGKALRQTAGQAATLAAKQTARIEAKQIDHQQFTTLLFDIEQVCPDTLIAPNGLPDDKRLAVYRNNVVVSLTKALEDIFPAIKRLIGAQNFKSLSALYIRQCPPTSPIIAEYGRDFADFIAKFEPLSKYPYLPDVARLERLWLDSFHAQDAEPLDPASMSDIAPQDLGNLRFEIHPAAHLFQSNYGCVTIFSNSRQERDLKGLDANKSEFALITRPYLEVDVRDIPQDAYLFYRALMKGESLSSAANIATDHAARQDHEFDLPRALATMLDAGFAVGWSLPDNRE